MTVVSKHLLRVLALLVVISMVLTGCVTAVPAQPAAPAAAAGASWWATAAAPYKGVTIRGVSENTPLPTL